MELSAVTYHLVYLPSQIRRVLALVLFHVKHCVILLLLYRSIMHFFFMAYWWPQFNFSNFQLLLSTYSFQQWAAHTHPLGMHRRPSTGVFSFFQHTWILKRSILYLKFDGVRQDRITTNNPFCECLYLPCGRSSMSGM